MMIHNQNLQQITTQISNYNRNKIGKFNQKSQNAKQKTQTLNADQKIFDSIQLVSLNQKGMYQINKSALQYLINIESQELKNKQIYMFSMIGKTKTGKSFLLNEILDPNNSSQENQIIQNSIFQVSNHLNSCTKGIQISKKYLTIKNQGKKDKIVLFLDNEGFGSIQSTEQNQYKIFILSLLLTSAIIYNSTGTIDQQTLNNFSMAIQISKLFKRKTQKEISQQNKISPHLLWILRDFTLGLVNKKGQKISTDQYLQNCLKQQIEMSQQKKKKRIHKQNIRKSIKQIFPQRSCQTLILPFQDNNIRSQFKTDLQKVKHKIQQLVQSGTCKKINLTQFVISLKAYVDYLNQTKNIKKGDSKFIFPEIQNMISQAKKAQQNNQLKKYKQEVKKVIFKYEKLINQYQVEHLTLQNYLNKISLAKSKLIIQLEQLNKKTQEISHKQNKFQSIEDLTFYQKLQKHGKQLQENFLNTINQKIQNRIKITESQRKNDQNEQQKAKQCERDVLKTIQECLINFQLSIDNITNLNMLQSEFMLIQQQFQLLMSNQISEQSWKKYQGKISNAKYQIQILYLRKKVVLLNQKQSQQNCIKEQLIELRKQMNRITKQNYQFKFDSKSKKQKNSKTSKESFDSVQIKNKNSKNKYESLHQMNGYTQYTNCSKSFYIPYVNISKPQYLEVQIAKTIVKQDNKGRQYFSFEIQVQLTQKRWNLGRKLKDFIQLNHILHIMFPKIQLPICEYLTINSHNKLFTKTKELKNYDQQCEMSNQMTLISERKKELQNYLNCLNDIQFIRNSRIFQKFIRINKDYLQSI